MIVGSILILLGSANLMSAGGFFKGLATIMLGALIITLISLANIG